MFQEFQVVFKVSSFVSNLVPLHYIGFQTWMHVKLQEKMPIFQILKNN